MVDRLLLKTMAELGGAAAILSQRVEDNVFHLQFHRPAYEFTSPQRETPWIMRGARDTDSLVGHHVSRRFCVASEAVSRVGAQIHFMMTVGNAERLRDFARS
jgi:hypothetical protein